ncbi:hypothetical protein B0T17DRAFT_640280 [Bombardia bombarda]|uniref:Wax synthase domain-containing protein n=1 Tax=Bombardia bombarda TaxID=252184 RepID=A0AA39X1E2_9PEZI|nr:hypothetical protein B0T17DRAFT_640280 [Bombardia bombarda]
MALIIPIVCISLVGLHSSHWEQRAVCLVCSIAIMYLAVCFLPTSPRHIVICLHLVMTGLLHHFRLLQIYFFQWQQWRPKSSQQTSGSSNRLSIWSASFKALMDFRSISTQQQRQQYKQKDNKDPSTKPPLAPQDLQQHRQTFLLNQFITVITIYTLSRALRHYLFTITTPSSLTPNLFDLLPIKTTLIRRLRPFSLPSTASNLDPLAPKIKIKPRELLFRLALLLTHQWTTWSVLTLSHSALALLFVGLNVDQPQEWPPLFGNPAAHAYTLRGYWSRFWHRLTYPTYTGYAQLLADNILRLRRGSIVYGLWMAVFVFAVSGMTHTASLVLVGFRCGYWEDLGWYLMNLGGIIVEDVVVWGAGAVVSAAGLEGRFRGKKVRWAGKMFGFFWVFGFQFWSLPKMAYPKAFCLPKEAYTGMTRGG